MEHLSISGKSGDLTRPFWLCAGLRFRIVFIGFRVKSLGLYVLHWAIQGFYGVA